MQYWSALLGYNLLVKSKQLTKTQFFIANIFHDDLYKVVDAIQSINIYTDLGILALE